MFKNKIHLLLCITLIISIFLLTSCANDDNDYIPYEPVEPVDLGEPLEPFVALQINREDVHFDDLPFYLPEVDDLREIYLDFVTAMDEAESAQEQLELIIEFDKINRIYADMARIAFIRFAQNIS